MTEQLGKNTKDDPDPETSRLIKELQGQEFGLRKRTARAWCQPWCNWFFYDGNDFLFFFWQAVMPDWFIIFVGYYFGRFDVFIRSQSDGFGFFTQFGVSSFLYICYFIVFLAFGDIFLAWFGSSPPVEFRCLYPHTGLSFFFLFFSFLFAFLLIIESIWSIFSYLFVGWGGRCVVLVQHSYISSVVGMQDIISSIPLFILDPGYSMDIIDIYKLPYHL